MSLDLEIIIMGDTIRIDAIITDYDGNLIEPTSHSIQLYTPFGAVSGVAFTLPTKTSVGHYNQEIDIPTASGGATAGRWYVRWAVVIGGKTSTGETFFDVKA